MQRFCRLLSENNFEIALVCRHYGGLEESQFPPHVKFYQLSSTSFFKKLPQLFSIIKDFNPDIVHTHFLVRDCIIPALKISRKYKYFISIWGSDINISSKKLVTRFIQNLGLLLCDKYHLLSPYFENKIQKLYYFTQSTKYSIFSWGIDYDFITNPQKDVSLELKKEFNLFTNDFIVLSYRNHKKIYNHHTLINSIPLIIDKFPNTKFIFTRSSFSKDYLEQTLSLVRDLKIEDNFIFINRWLSNSEMRSLINIADINVNIPFNDGLPATLFEIMSMNAIPIISNLDNYHPFFKNQINGFYLENLNDTSELSELIKFSLGNLDLYKNKFYSINDDYIRNHQNWQIQSKFFLDFYN
jgi:glycosyltransferase involved in cell wall biosynthesis